MFIGYYNKSMILTYIGVAVAVVGMVLATANHTQYALFCLAVSGICDLFDGIIARKCKRTEAEKQFGVEIDSLSDMVSFIALPIAICLGMGLTAWYHIVAYVLYALCGIERLGFFNVHVKKEGSEVPVKYYLGLPVTYAALIFCAGWFLHFFVREEVFRGIFTALMYILALCFVLKIKIVKPRLVGYIVFGILAIVICTLLVIL